MVFLFVEETKQRSLEELDHIFAVSKRDFMKFQTSAYLPWTVRRYIFGSFKPKPILYKDLVWGSEEVVAEEVKRTPVQPPRMSHSQNGTLQRTPVQPQPARSVATTEPDRSQVAEMEELYPPGVHVPYADSYQDGRTPAVPMNDAAFRNYNLPK